MCIHEGCLYVCFCLFVFGNGLVNIMIMVIKYYTLKQLAEQ